MSSIMLLRDHEEKVQDGAGSRSVGGKKGEVVSVPFIVRNQMLKRGIARDWKDSSQSVVQPEPQAEVANNANQQQGKK